MTRKEVEKFPQNIHILQVEQETEADDITVLQHLLNCDVEREKSMNELNDLLKIDDSKMTSDEKVELALKI